MGRAWVRVAERLVRRDRERTKGLVVRDLVQWSVDVLFRG